MGCLRDGAKLLLHKLAERKGSMGKVDRRKFWTA
jgi:hypothetical protein